MKLTVHLFARARDLAGSDAVTVTLPEGATVADLRRLYPWAGVADPLDLVLHPVCALDPYCHDHPGHHEVDQPRTVRVAPHLHHCSRLQHRRQREGST